METNSGQPGRTVLVAEPSRSWGGLCSLVQVWLAGALMILLFASVTWLLALSVLALAGIAFVAAVKRLPCRDQLIFDDEGVSLCSSRTGFLAPKPIRFRWDEVERVSRGIFPSRETLKIRLARPTTSSTFRRLSARTVLLAAAEWQDDRFIDALRRHVPPEQISPDALEPDWVPLWLRPAAGTLFLGCAAIVFASAVLALSESPISGYHGFMVVLACCFVAWFACFLAFGATSTVGGVVAGALSGCAVLQLPLFCLALLGGRSCVIVAGWMAAAGLLFGGAFLVCLGRRIRGYHVGLFYVLGIVGFAVGWLAYDGIPSKRVGEGDLLLYGWTADGDGFVTRRVVEDSEETVLQWYSADGEPDRAVTLPGGGAVYAVGRDAALYVARYQGGADAYVVPRCTGGPRLLLSKHFGYDVRVSPDSRRCVLSAWEDEEGPLLISPLVLPDGEMERFSPPAGHEDAENVGILDDGRLVWTIGERPTQPDGGRASHSAGIPPREMWPSIEERVDVWAWDPAKGGEPVCVYDAAQVWLDWRMSPTSDCLFVCRVIEDPSPRREFVAVLLTGEGPEIRPSRKERFWSSDPLSPDGRFLVKDVEDAFPPQTRVYDAETGETRRLRETALCGMDRFLWSPRDHRFLYMTLESRLFRLRWRGTIADETADSRWVVRLVDLGE